MLDAESTDATRAIAQAHGATVEVRAWRGFSEARTYALGRVTTPYAFMLDADEQLDAVLREALQRPLDARAGFRVHRVTYLAGMPVRTAGWSAERLLRCVQVERARCVPNSVGGGADLHERWEVEGDVGDLPGTLRHDSYPTYAAYREKFDRYTRLEAAALPPSPRAFVRALVRAPLRFAWLWARYGGWRDGRRGLFVAWHSARYPLVVQWRALRA